VPSLIFFSATRPIGRFEELNQYTVMGKQLALWRFLFLLSDIFLQFFRNFQQQTWIA